jgi:hypothetical protein
MPPQTIAIQNHLAEIFSRLQARDCGDLPGKVPTALPCTPAEEIIVMNATASHTDFCSCEQLAVARIEWFAAGNTDSAFVAVVFCVVAYCCTLQCYGALTRVLRRIDIAFKAQPRKLAVLDAMCF